MSFELIFSPAQIEHFVKLKNPEIESAYQFLVDKEFAAAAARLLNDTKTFDAIYNFYKVSLGQHLNFLTSFESTQDFIWTVASPLYFPVVNLLLAAASLAVALFSAFCSLKHTAAAACAYLSGNSVCGEVCLTRAKNCALFSGLFLATTVLHVAIAAVSAVTDTARLVTRSAASFFSACTPRGAAMRLKLFPDRREQIVEDSYLIH